MCTYEFYNCRTISLENVVYDVYMYLGYTYIKYTYQ